MKHWGRSLVTGLPLLWLLLFFLMPFVLVLQISLQQFDGVRLEPLVAQVDGRWQWSGQWSTYLLLLQDDLYISSYLRSAWYALLTTLLCLLLGYPFAYFMARARSSLQPLLLMGVMLPFWTSFLLRVYAWKGLLDARTGWIGQFLVESGISRWLAQWGLVNSPTELLYSPFSLMLGMVYTYLPFMVLPLYATLSKMDGRLLEAAQDLGATPWQSFWRVTVPMSRSGIMAGAMLVFIPCVGEYVIPELLGGPNTLMIGRVLWDEFFASNDWPMASTVAVIMMLLILIPLALFNYSQDRAELREGRR
ncbi:ABC transporter permease [Corticibacter populi]|uniref:ABC transporter permease n=1 Tax=Corticibacter populi TaxID=1550736 RepID=A0A3M6QTK1_9BURK|nr:ABC transporter permease [Corticibacter populi]RMX05802.1 ABC transporter permease [Corticibacter populi]RZS30888.1 putrescine transport system permease protein [Corticibacter populi]